MQRLNEYEPFGTSNSDVSRGGGVDGVHLRGTRCNRVERARGANILKVAPSQLKTKELFTALRFVYRAPS